MSFEPAKYGLLSHYSPDAQQRIRRLILEDWKAAGVKLPTYMKLLARYIASTGVSEDWLAKLSHQTMDKTLKSISTPRHEFWACLHLYISKKYGQQDIEPNLSDADILGQALARFGGVEDAFNDSGAENAVTGLTIEASPQKPYALAELIETSKSDEPFGVEIEQHYQGAVIAQGSKLVAILRSVMTRQIKTLEMEL